MKIVQVQTQAEAAGAQRISDMVGAGLRARGHSARVVFMYRKTDVYDEDPNVDFILPHNTRGFMDELKAAIGLIFYLRREKPDAVITYQYWGNLFGTIGARLSGARYIVANQSGAPKTSGLLGLVSKLDRLMGTWGWYQKNIVNSPWTLSQFDDYPKGYRDRLHMIDHGVLAPAARYDKAAARAVFGLPPDVPIMLTSGRQTEEKNQMALLPTLSHVSNLHLAIAGVGPKQDEILDTAISLGVSDRLHMVGEVPPNRIFEFLATGDLFAFASTNETFGLSAAEAALAGLPLVVNDLEVLREVLVTKDGNSAAIFVDANDPDALSDAVSQVLRDENLAGRLSDAGKLLAARYSPDVMSDAYEALLRD